MRHRSCCCPAVILDIPLIGVRNILKGFAVVITGGFGNVKGTVVAAYLLGIIENFSIAYIPREWRDMLAFSLMIIVLLFRPHGVFGKE
jgi:branched-chain amino acid transport system permease protein